MEIERTFTLFTDESTARERIATFFDQSGYQKTSEKGTRLSFKRGSKVGSWIALNPSQLLSLVDIQIKAKGSQIEVRADFEVKAVFKDDTHFTEKFWDAEIKELETALVKGEYSSYKTKNLTRRAMLAIARSLVIPLIYLIIWGALSLGLTILILRTTGLSSSYPDVVAVASLVIAGFAVYFVSRYWKRWRKGKTS
jgi:hypothetical protein